MCFQYIIVLPFNPIYPIAHTWGTWSNLTDTALNSFTRNMRPWTPQKEEHVLLGHLEFQVSPSLKLTSPLSNDGWRMKFPFGMALFSGMYTYYMFELSWNRQTHAFLLRAFVTKDGKRYLLEQWDDQRCFLAEKTTMWEARDLPCQPGQSSSSASKEAKIQVVQKRNSRWWLYTPNHHLTRWLDPQGLSLRISWVVVSNVFFFNVHP